MTAVWFGGDYDTVPLELSIPLGLGAFFRSVTLKSMGISFELGGLYSCLSKVSQITLIFSSIQAIEW